MSVLQLFLKTKMQTAIFKSTRSSDDFCAVRLSKCLPVQSCLASCSQTQKTTTGTILYTLFKKQLVTSVCRFFCLHSKILENRTSKTWFFWIFNLSTSSQICTWNIPVTQLKQSKNAQYCFMSFLLPLSTIRNYVQMQHLC
jgi:hypothetical protein